MVNKDDGYKVTVLQPDPKGNSFDEITKYIDENIRVFRVRTSSGHNMSYGSIFSSIHHGL